MVDCPYLVNMNRWLNRLAALIFGKNSDRETGRFALSGSMGNALVQFGSMALVFGINILIARIGGKEAYGTFSQVFNWIFVLFIISAFGSDTLLNREVPAMRAKNDDAGIFSILRFTHSGVLLISILVVGIFAFLVNVPDIPGLKNNARYFNISLICIPLAAFTFMHQAFLRSIKKVVWGQTAEKLAKPIGLGLGIMGIYLLADPTLPESYIYANVFAFSVAFLYSLFLFFRFRKTIPKIFPGREKRKNEWMRRSLWFTSAALLYVLTTRLDILFIGSLIDNTAVGYYNVALKFADLTILPSFIISQSIAPLFSELHSQGKKKELQQLFTRSSRLIFGLTLIIFIGFIFLGEFCLGLYGEPFKEGYETLLILSGSRLLYSIIGPIGLLMLLIGEERAMNIGFLIQILLMTVGLYLLIPLWGMEGAALINGTGFVLLQGAMAIRLFYSKGYKGTVF